MPARAIHCHSLCELLVALLDGNSNCHGHANHGVVTCADQAHHLYVCGHGGGACELRVAVHTAEGIGHAVGGRACSHVIGMQGTSGCSGVSGVSSVSGVAAQPKVPRIRQTAKSKIKNFLIGLSLCKITSTSL